MGKAISSKLSSEWSRGKRLHFPESAQRGRGILPSYADATQVIAAIEPLTITVATPALTINTTATVTQTMSLEDISSVNLAKFDTGHLIVTNVSAVPPANTFASHPMIQIITSQGNPKVGVLSPGTDYSNMRVKVSCTVYATAAASAGTLTINATALLVGAAQDV